MEQIGEKTSEGETMTQPNELDLLEMEHALLTAGWKKVHATQFWRSPKGFLGASITHAYESMKNGVDAKKQCLTCGQDIY